MEDIAALTPELFTAETGINVNYSVLEEGTPRGRHPRHRGVRRAVRRRDDRHVRGAAIRYQRLAHRPHPLRRSRRVVPFDDLIPTVRDGLFRSRDVRIAVLRRVVVPHVPHRCARGGRPDHARESNVGRGGGDRPRRRLDEMAGICLRGKPGWGDLGASFTTVLNMFGGTWGWPTRTAPSARPRSISPSSRRRCSSTSI